MILARNCPHHNGIYTFIDDRAGLVIKSSYRNEGQARLEIEQAGYHWYFQQGNILTPLPVHFFKNAQNNYARLTIKKFSGRSGECYKNLAHNKSHLQLAIKAYTEIWPKNKGQLVPIHGDFSIGNMIFQQDTVTIIDWEHFKIDVAPWGLDLLNMLYESAFFSFQGKSYLRHEDLNVFRNLYQMIRTHILIPFSLEKLIEFIIDNQEIWGPVIKKLPVMQFTREQKQYLQQNT